MVEPEALDLDRSAPGLAPEEQAAVVQRAVQGDEAAWERLLDAHQQPVFRLAYLLVGDADEAEDIAQETFIRAYRGLEGFNAGRPLRPWLLKIAANLAYNRGRTLRRYLAALKRTFLADVQAAPPAIERPGERSLESALLWQAVRRLSPADQQVIYLRYYLDLPVEETAQALGVAPGTVKSRLHRALERLRAVIRREVPELEEDDGYGPTSD